MTIRKSRLGIFFVLIGIISLAIFFTADQSMELQPLPLFFGLAATLVGYYFIRKEWKPSPPTQRFAMLRKIRQKRREAKEKQQQKQQAKK